jgi:hypothetical protein
MSALNDPVVWSAFGSGGFAGLLSAGAAAFGRRSNRLSRLEKEVQDCRERDAHVVVLAAGFRLMVGAMARREPNAPELKICRDLLDKHIPLRAADTNLACFADVLEALDELPDPPK